MLSVSDFTYVATWQGFVYVAFVIDAFARRIVGLAGVAFRARRFRARRAGTGAVQAATGAADDLVPIVTAACSTFRSATPSVCSRLSPR